MQEYNLLVEQVEELQNTMKVIQEKLGKNIEIRTKLEKHNM